MAQPEEFKRKAESLDVIERWIAAGDIGKTQNPAHLPLLEKMWDREKRAEGEMESEKTRIHAVKLAIIQAVGNIGHPGGARILYEGLKESNDLLSSESMKAISRMAGSIKAKPPEGNDHARALVSQAAKLVGQNKYAMLRLMEEELDRISRGK